MTAASPSLARAREIAEQMRINRAAYKMGAVSAEYPDAYLIKAIAAALDAHGDAEWNSAVEACAAAMDPNALGPRAIWIAKELRALKRRTEESSNG